MKLGNFLFFIFSIFSVFLLVPAVSAKVFINEVFPSQNVIELYNFDNTEINIAGWSILTSMMYESKTLSGVISPKGHLLINLAGTKGLDPSEEEITLFKSIGETEDFLSYTWEDYIPYNEEGLNPQHSYGRYPDGKAGAKGVEFSFPSPGESNFNLKVFGESQLPFGDIQTESPVVISTIAQDNYLSGYSLISPFFNLEINGQEIKKDPTNQEIISEQTYKFKLNLPAKFFKKGDAVKWKFYGIDESGKETIGKITGFKVINTPPVKTKAIPSQTTDEGISTVVDLNSYFSDGDGDSMFFNVLSAEPNGHLLFIKEGLKMTIVPAKDWHGTESIKVSVTDGEAAVESNLFDVVVNSVNDAPVAVSQEVSATEDVPVTIALSSIDIDTPADFITYKIVDAPKKGTLSGSGQTVTYIPNPEANGVDTFAFLVNDGTYDSAPAIVTVNIAAVADAPKFNLDSFKIEIYEDGFKAVSLNNYLTDADTPLNDLTFTYAGQEPELNFKLDEAKNEMYITSLVKDWFGEKKVFLTVFDVGGVLSDTAEMTIKVNQLKDDAPAITSFYPLYDVAIGEDKIQEFKLELNDPDKINPKFEWYVDGKKQSDVDNIFIFDAKKYSVNEHKIKGKVVGYSLEKEWIVKLVDKPVFDKFNGATTDLSKLNQAQLKSVNLALEKLGYGKIVFDTPVDLTEILDLNNVVELGSNLAAVDKLNAPALNVPATITLYKVKFNNPVVLSYDGFTTDASLVNALCSDCQAISKGADSITFKTKHFSSMKLGESTSLQLNVPSAVSFEEGERGATVAAQFDLTNAGTSALSNLKISSTAASQYGAVFSLDGVTYSNTVTLNGLSVGMIKPIFVKATVPTNIDSGWQDIGDILIVDTTLSKTIGGFYLKAKDYLVINEIKVNGKTDGELVPGEINEIKVVVENVLGDGDLENIDVTATLLNVNKKDLDEEESSFDLKSGASKKVSFEFELPYNLEEGSYELEIEAVGETKEGAEIEMTKIFEIDVEREGHQITIDAIKSLPAKVDFCDDKTVLIETKLINIGNTAEKDLTLKLQSGGKVLREKTGLVLEKYTGKASQTAIFEIETSNLKEGKNILTLELFNSKNNFDAKEFILEAENCAVQEKAQEKKIEVKESILPAASDAGSKSKQKEKITESTVLAVRNTQEYLVLVLLGIVVLGGIILLLLGLYVFRRK